MFSSSEPWKQQAACRGMDPNLFFVGVDAESDRKAPGAEICLTRCPVVTDCLDYAIANNERDGVWGGKTFRQRQAVRRLNATMHPDMDVVEDLVSGW